MPQIPFCGATYEGRSPNINASRAVNWYPELTGVQDDKAQIAMVNTPGLNIFALGVGSYFSAVRGLYTFNGLMYVVVYNKLYSVNTAGTPSATPLGTLSTTTGRIDFASNGVTAHGVGGDQLMIVDGTDGYIYNITSTVFTKISGGGWPGTPKQVEYIDGYFVVINGTMSYWVSNLYDGLTWNALATSPVSGTSDDIVSVINHRQQLFFLKTLSTEVWYNAGTPTTAGSPFQRTSGAVYSYGVAAQWSVAKGGSSFYFLCTQRTADGGETVGVAEITEFTPVMISPPAINYRITASTTHANCFGYCYIEQGHIFYVLTNPDDNWTLCYDATTKMWHERSSLQQDAMTVNRHMSNCYTFFNNKHYVGDYRNSNIYEMSSEFNTDNGNAIFSFRTAQIIWDNNAMNNLFINKLILDIETGVGVDIDVITPTLPFKLGWGGNVAAVDKGTYAGGTAYVLHDIVTYNAVQYLCIQNGTGHTPDVSPTYWTTPIPNVLWKLDGALTLGAVLNSSSNPLIYLSWSNDSGHTWSAEYPISMGAENEYSTRVLWRRLGMARNRVFKVASSAAVKKNLVGAYIEVSK